jgi:hypothetical protein
VLREVKRRSVKGYLIDDICWLIGSEEIINISLNIANNNNNIE